MTDIFGGLLGGGGFVVTTQHKKPEWYSKHNLIIWYGLPMAWPDGVKLDWFRYNVETPYSKEKPVYKTQKARGLEIGWTLSSMSGYGYKVPPVAGVLPHMNADLLKEVVFPKFARPCPLVPRHGFVESRLVSSLEEVEALLKETHEHDKEGELILMDRLSGKHSAVMTATGVSWGMSNDGVTSGKGVNLHIPAPSGKFDAMFLPFLGLPANANQGVYAELVEDNGAVCVVQMRLGPKQQGQAPKRYTVGLSNMIRHILRPESDDLIVWDKKLNDPNNKLRCAQTLIWLPGQTMASHFAVQGIANGYNVSVEKECPIEVLGVLRPDTSAPIDMDEADYKTLAKMFEAEKKTRFWDYPRDVLLSVGVLHSLPYWSNEHHLLALRARGAMIAARYGLAACLGESRHHLHMSETPAKVPWDKLIEANPNLGGMRPSRSYVFVRSFAMPWEMGQDLAKAAAADMQIAGQPPVTDHLAKGGKLGEYGASFMGHRWEWAALRVHDLHAAINRFTNDPNKTNWGVILGHYNEIINAAHNGGYLLNKWCDASLIDNAASAPALVFGYRNVMQLLYGDAKEEPRLPWLPMSKKPVSSDAYNKVDLTDTGEQMLVHSAVWEQCVNDGLLDALDQCICYKCIKPKLESIGKTAMEMVQPCYVPDDLMGIMPSVDGAVKDDDYSKAMAQAMDVPAPMEDPDDHDYPMCEMCETKLVDGKCPNEDCEECPDHVGTCFACDSELDGDGDCSNEDCSQSPAWIDKQKKELEEAKKLEEHNKKMDKAVKVLNDVAEKEGISNVVPKEG